MTRCPYCRQPLCPECKRCVREGHDWQCPSEDARQRLAAWERREAEAIRKREELEEQEVGSDKAVLVRRIAERFNWGR